MCFGNLTAFPDAVFYNQRIIETWSLGMRKPRDFDAEINSLENRARTLKDRKIRQMGELQLRDGRRLCGA